MVPKARHCPGGRAARKAVGTGTADSPQPDRLGVTWGVPELGSTVTEIGHR